MYFMRKFKSFELSRKKKTKNTKKEEAKLCLQLKIMSFLMKFYRIYCFRIDGAIQNQNDKASDDSDSVDIAADREFMGCRSTGTIYRREQTENWRFCDREWVKSARKAIYQSARQFVQRLECNHAYIFVVCRSKSFHFICVIICRYLALALTFNDVFCIAAKKRNIFCTRANAWYHCWRLQRHVYGHETAYGKFASNTRVDSHTCISTWLIPWWPTKIERKAWTKFKVQIYVNALMWRRCQNVIIVKQID